ncbi:MAG: YidC/Oxa1 family insertase periplasmic-domain containing protein [Planctomycetota bacterium]|jgi:YidC/Oxa1 family membrane protein insertase
MRIALTLVVIAFVLLCGWLVVESGLFNGSSQVGQSCILLKQVTAGEEQETISTPAPEKEQPEVVDFADLGATGGIEKSVTLGSTDRKSGYKYELELSSKAAAIRKATFSEFDDRDHKNAQPLVILSPVPQADGSEILSMANQGFQNDALVQQKREVPLQDLDWKSFGVEKAGDGSQTARFEATIILKDTGEPVVKLAKTYKVSRDSYLLDCDITVENLGDVEQKVRFNLAGPGGLGREAFRTDMRKVVAGFRDSEGQIVSARLDRKKLAKAKSLSDRRLTKPGANFLWIAAVNKYFAAIVVPLADEGKNYCDWVRDKTGRFHNPDGDSKADSGDETIGLDLAIATKTLAATGQVGSSKTYNFQLYLGPKDKSLFDKKEFLLFSIGSQFQSDLDRGIISEALQEQFKNNSILLSPDVSVLTKDKGEKWLIADNKGTYSIINEKSQLNIYRKLYRDLGFVWTIDFMGCCCPGWIIKPLAFGILAIMKWMHGFIPNYGVVIIILVFLMRLCMHPITKKSQVSMSKMGQLAPKAEEIKKKYANNKAEMNKQMMALYREQGASPIMGFLPMMVQMPIWIALWSAVYASIDLRGAGFLPFWITDLSIPDALYRFPTVIVVPLLGWKIESLNLLPLMMGVAFYLQQRLMPTQASASTNPQMAQQQKMMKIMLPLMFPLMLYKAPSGVNLYIMASTFAGVFEQHVIRRHIREKEQAESEGLVAATSKTGGKVKKKKPKPFYRNM